MDGGQRAVQQQGWDKTAAGHQRLQTLAGVGDQGRDLAHHRLLPLHPRLLTAEAGREALLHTAEAPNTNVADNGTNTGVFIHATRQISTHLWISQTVYKNRSNQFISN